MREHPVLSLGPLKFNLFGKIPDEGQFAGNFNLSSSETTREAFILNKLSLNINEDIVRSIK
jgi:hypothetical protein